MFPMLAGHNPTHVLFRKRKSKALGHQLTEMPFPMIRIRIGFATLNAR
jgi:hypothetical protein